jgi:hypothetical protein
MRLHGPAGLLALTTLAAAGAAAASTYSHGTGEGDHAERTRLAAAILRGTEQASGRALDPAFRRRALVWLEGLEVEELASRELRAASQGLGPLALGDSGAQLVYTPVAPCRILDTRVAGGRMEPGTTRDFLVTGTGLGAQGGTPAGCNVPRGPATVAMLNFVAVNPAGAGNLRAWPYRTPPTEPPLASVLNYALVSGLNIANGIAVPICDPSEPGQTCPFELRARADAGTTDLVVDVLGYFERFPKEAVRSVSVFAQSNTQTAIPGTCTHVPGLNVTVAAPASGTITVRANLIGRIQHAAGFDETLVAYIGASPADCQAPHAAHGLNDLVPTANFGFMLPVTRSFPVSPGTYSFYANALMSGSPTLNDFVNFNASWSTLEATFTPD